MEKKREDFKSLTDILEFYEDAAVQNPHAAYIEAIIFLARRVKELEGTCVQHKELLLHLAPIIGLN